VYPNDDLAVIILTNLAGGQPEQMIDTVAGFYLPTLRQELGGAYALYLLRQTMGKGGFDNMEQRLATIRQQHALPAPDENDLNAWGYRLLRRQQASDAIAIFQLAVRLYPDSANGHDSLAEAAEAAGDTALAVTHYRRSVELDPGNQHAISRLTALAPNQAIAPAPLPPVPAA